MKHKHRWRTPHAVWEGRTDEESMIARYCTCGTIEIAYVMKWRKANLKTKIYPDVIEMCLKQINQIKRDKATNS